MGRGQCDHCRQHLERRYRHGHRGDRDELDEDAVQSPCPGGVLFASIGVPVVLRRRRGAARALRSALLALLFVGAGTLLQSCGGGGSAATPTGTYMVPITATAWIHHALRNVFADGELVPPRLAFSIMIIGDLST